MQNILRTLLSLLILLNTNTKGRNQRCGGHWCPQIHPHVAAARLDLSLLVREMTIWRRLYLADLLFGYNFPWESAVIACRKHPGLGAHICIVLILLSGIDTSCSSLVCIRHNHNVDRCFHQTAKLGGKMRNALTLAVLGLPVASVTCRSQPDKQVATTGGLRRFT